MKRILKRIFTLTLFLFLASGTLAISVSAATENLDEMEARKLRYLSDPPTRPIDELEDASNGYVWQPETLMYEDQTTGHEVWVLMRGPDEQSTFSTEYGNMLWSMDGSTVASQVRSDARPSNNPNCVPTNRPTTLRKWLVKTDGTYLKCSSGYGPHGYAGGGIGWANTELAYYRFGNAQSIDGADSWDLTKNVVDEQNNVDASIILDTSVGEKGDAGVGINPSRKSVIKRGISFDDEWLSAYIDNQEDYGLMVPRYASNTFSFNSGTLTITDSNAKFGFEKFYRTATIDEVSFIPVSDGPDTIFIRNDHVDFEELYGFREGDKLIITGSARNDGVYYLAQTMYSDDWHDVTLILRNSDSVVEELDVNGITFKTHYEEITVEGSENNDGTYQVEDITDNTIYLSPGQTLTDESGTSGVKIGHYMPTSGYMRINLNQGVNPTITDHWGIGRDIYEYGNHIKRNEYKAHGGALWPVGHEHEFIQIGYTGHESNIIQMQTSGGDEDGGPKWEDWNGVSYGREEIVPLGPNTGGLERPPESTFTYMGHPVIDNWQKHVFFGEYGQYDMRVKPGTRVARLSDGLGWDGSRIDEDHTTTNGGYVDRGIATGSRIDDQYDGRHHAMNAWADSVIWFPNYVGEEQSNIMYGADLDFETGNVVNYPLVHIHHPLFPRYDVYACLPRPSQSPDGTKVMFQAAWLNNNDDRYCYPSYAVVYYPKPPTDLLASGRSGNIRLEFLPPRYSTRGWPEDDDPVPFAREVKRYHVWRKTDTGDWDIIGSVEQDYGVFPRGDEAYEIYQPARPDGSEVTNINNMYYIDDDSLSDGTYYYALTTEEHSRLESRELSEILQVTISGEAITSTRIASEIPKTNFWTTKPLQPRNFAKSGSPGDYLLTWTEPENSDTTKIRYYNIYYSTSGNPPADRRNRIASVPIGTYKYLDWQSDPTLTGYYGITSVDRQGIESDIVWDGPVVSCSEAGGQCYENPCNRYVDCNPIGGVCSAESGDYCCQTSCIPCSTQDDYGCYGGNVYWLDSCGNVEVEYGMVEDCEGRGCTNGVCNSGGCDCTTWEDLGCGAGNCQSWQKAYSRECTPDACALEFRCENDPSCGMPPPIEAVGYWKFDEGSGTTVTDYSGNGNDGTFTGGVSWSENGRFGSALGFNGDDGVLNVGSDSSLDDINLDGGMTIAAWANFDSGYGEGSINTILSKNEITDIDGRWYFGISQTGGLFFMKEYTGDDLTSRTGDTVDAGDWHHLAVTWNSGTNSDTDVTFYIDGNAAESSGTSDASGTPVSDAANNLLIGNGRWGSRAIDGRLDEVIVFNRALTTQEILTVMDRASCSEGEITELCYCGGNFYSSGYCCAGQYSNEPCGGCLHESDENCDGCIDIVEAMNYLQRWYLDSTDVTQVELREAIDFYKKGTGC